MAKRPTARPLARPTEGELAILTVLWDIGPATVRQILETLNRRRPTGYTTVLKLLQIMTDKALVTRNEKQRSHVYRAKHSEDQTQKQLVRDLLDRAFAGSAQKLVMHALAAKKASPEELAEIRKLLDQAEAEGDKK